MIASEAFKRLANRGAILADPDIGGHDDRIVQLLLPEVAHEHGRGVQMVHRDIEEPCIWWE